MARWPAAMTETIRTFRHWLDEEGRAEKLETNSRWLNLAGDVRKTGTSRSH